MNTANHFFKKILLAALTGMALLVSGCQGAAKGVVYLCDDDRYMGAFRYVDVKNADGGSAGLSYALNSDGTQAIVAIGTCTVAAVVVPDTYNAIPVVGVAESGFASVTTMTSITLPAAGTFTRIGSQAFEDTVIASIAIPSGVTALNPSTFLNCKSLVTVTFSGTSSVASIGDNCFAFDSALKNIQLPISCSSVGDSSFKNCLLLERFLFPKSVASFTIGISAFDGCEKMGFIFFSASVTSIGTYAFRGCINGKAYFAGALPSGYSSTGLWDYTYNSNENSSANYYLTIVATNVGDMGYNSGYYYIVNTDGTITIYYYDGSAPTDTAGSVDLVIPSILDGRTVIGVGQYVFKDHAELNSVTFPDTLTTLAIGCFEGCTNLTAIHFGTGLLTIGDYAFSYGINNAIATKVTTLTIPASVTTIGNYSFYGFTLLTSLTFTGAAANASALTTIGQYAFYYAGFSAYSASTLPTLILTLPGTLTLIDNNAFYQAYVIKSLIFTNHFLSDGTTVSPSLVIGSGADSTNSDVFYNLLYTTSVTLSSNITNLHSYAFANSASTTTAAFATMPSLYIPATVLTMGQYVFHGRTHFTIYCAAASKPSGWNALWAGTLNTYVSNMTNVTVATPSYFNVGPGSGQRIQVTNGLFEYVEDSVGSGTTRYMTLSRFDYDPNNSNCVTVSVANTFTSTSYSGYTFVVDAIGDGAFFNSYSSTGGKKSLTTLNLPSAIKTIGDFAFAMNIALATLYPTGGTSVTGTANFPASLTSLGTYSFGSTPIVVASLPAGIASLGAATTNPFYSCFKLTTLTIASGCTTYYTENNLIYKIGATDYSEIVYAASDYLGLSNTITIPAGCLTIDDRAFAGERAVKYVEIPYSVTTIGNYAFYVGAGANFSGAPTAMALTKVRYYTSTGYTTPAVTTLGGYAFQTCVSLTDMEFPSSLTTIGTYAFSGDTALKYCYTLPTQTSSDVTLGNLNLSGTAITGLGTYAFNACPALKSVEFPSTLTSLGSYAFLADTGLTSASFAAATGTLDLGTYAFSGDTALTSVTLPTGTGASTTIEDLAFQSCTSLASIYIPTTTKFAHSNGSGSNAPFLSCTGMTGIYLADTGTSYDARKTTAFKLGWNYKNTNKTDYQIPFYCYAGPDDGTTRSAATDAVESDMLYWHYVGGVMTPWAN